jgi:hypothetical protein
MKRTALNPGEWLWPTGIVVLGASQAIETNSTVLVNE